MLGDAFELPKIKCSALADSLSTAVGVKHRGEPEECPKKAANEASVVKNATPPTDEPYITAGVGSVEGLTDVLNTSKLPSVRGEP